MAQLSLHKKVDDVAGHRHPWPVVIPDPRDVKSIVTFAVVAQVTQRHLMISQDPLDSTANSNEQQMKDDRRSQRTIVSERRAHQKIFYIVEKASISRTFESILEKSRAFMRECEAVNDVLSAASYNASFAPSRGMTSFTHKVYYISAGLNYYWGFFMTNTTLDETTSVVESTSHIGLKDQAFEWEERHATWLMGQPGWQQRNTESKPGFENARSNPELVTNDHSVDASPCQQHGQRASPFLPTSAEYLHDPVTYHGRLDGLETSIVKLCSQFMTLTLNTVGTKNQKQQIVVVSNGSSLYSPNDAVVAISPDVVEDIIATSKITAAIMKAFTHLQDNDFCGTEFNIAVLHPSIPFILRIVPISREILEYLAEIAEDAISLIQARAYEAVDLEKCLENWVFTATHILEYLGLGTQNCQNLESGCSLFLCLMNMLSFSLMSYAGSHISGFHKKILRGVDKPLLDSDIFRFDLPSGNHICLQRYGLACLERYIGAPVWAFSIGSAGSPETLASMKIMTSLKSFTDLWGPVQVVYQNPPSKLISAILLDEGLILSAVQSGEAQGKGHDDDSENDVVHCHWYSSGEKFPRSDPFEDTAMLLIGGDDSRRYQRPEYDLKVNTACNREGLGPVLKETSWPQSIGVRERTYEIEAVDYTAGFSLHVKAEVKGQVKSRPGQTVKGLLRMKWANADSDNNLMPPELGDLNLRLCVEISACTGNAQRIELWEIFKIKNVRKWILESIHDLEDDGSPESTPTKLFLDAVDDGPDAFKAQWGKRIFRKNAVRIIGTVLQFLDSTGPQEKATYGPVPRLGQEKVLAAWFPGIKPDGSLILQKEHRWTEILTNSAKEAALVVLSKTCLQSTHPEGIRCDEQDGRRTVLRTALVASSSQRRDRVREERPRQSYATMMPSSSARDDSSIRSLMAKLKLSDSQTGRSRMPHSDTRFITESRYPSAAVSGLYRRTSSSRHHTAPSIRNTKGGQRTAEHHSDAWIKAIIGSRIHGYTTLHLSAPVLPRRGRGRMFLRLHDGNKIEAIGDRMMGDRESYWEFMNYDEQKNDMEHVLYVCVA